MKLTPLMALTESPSKFQPRTCELNCSLGPGPVRLRQISLGDEAGLELGCPNLVCGEVAELGYSTRSLRFWVMGLPSRVVRAVMVWRPGAAKRWVASS